MTQSRMASREWFKREESGPKASKAALTAKEVMGLVRRSRACARNAGLAAGVGTRRTRNGLSHPGRGILHSATDCRLANADRNDSTPQPAGETAPIPAMAISVIRVSICAE